MFSKNFSDCRRQKTELSLCQSSKAWSHTNSGQGKTKLKVYCTVCAKSPGRSIKNRFLNLLLIRFWPWKGPIVVQLDRLVLGEVAIAIDDGLQPPQHRLYQVLRSVLSLPLSAIEWLSFCGAVHYITSQTKSFCLRMMRMGAVIPRGDAIITYTYTGQDFWRILYIFAMTGHFPHPLCHRTVHFWQFSY